MFTRGLKIIYPTNKKKAYINKEATSQLQRHYRTKLACGSFAYIILKIDSFKVIFPMFLAINFGPNQNP